MSRRLRASESPSESRIAPPEPSAALETARHALTAEPQRRGRPSKSTAIRAWLAVAIANGEFATGDQLPSEHTLMARFDVCRATVRQAFHDLCHAGIVSPHQGKGYYVSRLTAVHNLERLQSFGEMMAPLGLQTRSVLIEHAEVPASREVSEALRIGIDDAVMRIVRTRIAGHTVVSLDISYFPVDIGRPLAALDLANEDVFLLLENQLGVELGYADLLIDLAPALPGHAALLGVTDSQTVFRIRRLCHDNNGRPIDYEHLYARQDALQFKVRTSRW